jgi:hypothetical protein
MQPRWFTLSFLVLASGILLSGANKDCIFLNNPNELMLEPDEVHKANSDLTSRVSMVMRNALAADQPTVQTLDASTVPLRNFIDDAIFSRMASAGIQSAPIASNTEFLRRVTLDLKCWPEASWIPVVERRGQSGRTRVFSREVRAI